MPLICAAKAEEKIPTVSSNGSRNELALIRALYIHPIVLYGERKIER
jgi:hypothetical protein